MNTMNKTFARMMLTASFLAASTVTFATTNATGSSNPSHTTTANMGTVMTSPDSSQPKVLVSTQDNLTQSNTTDTTTQFASDSADISGAASGPVISDSTQTPVLSDTAASAATSSTATSTQPKASKSTTKSKPHTQHHSQKK